MRPPSSLPKPPLAALVAVAALLAVGIAYVWQRPIATQDGFRGTGMDQFLKPAAAAAIKAANILPDPIDKADPGGQKATEVYKNVQVLTDLSEDQFNRVMLSITNWVAPEQGCAYCHNVENLADDSMYQKKVARQMLAMTRHINTEWKPHVATTGVTCYTCHRGLPVPAQIWFDNPGPKQAGGFTPTNHGMGHPNALNGSTSLPGNPLAGTLNGKDAIRVQATAALPGQPGASIMDAEHTYALMIHLSNALGVNCTFCHNTQSFSKWEGSTAQRVTAWHGIQMARDLNATYLEPLKTTLPANRLGPLGDSPKVNCATCHQGANKPLLGAAMAADYPELGGGAR